MSLRHAAALLLLCITHAHAASVTGRVGTPSGIVPALTLHAWSLTGNELYTQDLAAGQTHYTLDLPRGRYWLFATPADPGAPPIYGAYTEFVTCVRDAATGVECRAHGLRVVTVVAHPVTGVDLMDWRLEAAAMVDLDRVLGRPLAEAEEEAELSAPKFSEYPAVPMAGAHAEALLAGSESRAERDHDLLTAALGGNPNFAGRMAVLRVSCGNGCESAALVDLATGRVAYPAPLGALPAATACGAGGALRFRRDSRLLTVTGREGGELLTRYYVWDPENGTLRLLAALASALGEPCGRTN
jgi:hypothetical protein